MADPCAADLRSLVRIQRPSFSDDGAGGSQVAWLAYSTAQTAAKLKSGSEPLYRGRKETRADAVFTMRYRNDIRTIDRLIFRGRVYAITDVEDLRRLHKWTIVEAKLWTWDNDPTPSCFLTDNNGDPILTDDGSYIFTNGGCDYLMDNYGNPILTDQDEHIAVTV